MINGNACFVYFNKIWGIPVLLAGTSYSQDVKRSASMSSLIPTVSALQRRLAGLPVVKQPAREIVVSAGSQTGKLLFLRSGAVEVIKDGVNIANVSTAGSVFGEQAVLLNQPHTADVRTVENSEFYVADAQAILSGDPTVALYVAAVLARRLDAANRSLIEVKRQLEAGKPSDVIGRMVEKVQEQLSYSDDASLVYGGYPYDPYRPDMSVVECFETDCGVNYRSDRLIWF